MKFFSSDFFLSKKYDWVLIFIVILITAVGLASIYGIDLSRGGSLVFFPNQLIAFVLGISAMFFLGRFHISFFQSTAKWWYLSSFLLLVLVLIFGLNIRGTTGWFKFAGFSFQPAEFAKIGLIVWLAEWIKRQGRDFRRWQFVVSSGVGAGILAGLILLQPDLGSASVLIGIWFGLLFLTDTKKTHIAVLIGLFLIVFSFAWFFMFKDYQRQRVATFLDPATDPLGSGYNVIQSMIAIGSGGLFGRGLGFGSQSQLHFLPEAQTDFIFSVISEELGFVGVVAVMILFFLLILRLLYLAKLCRDDFYAFLVLGIALLFLIQIFVNVGAATGILPVTGVTLPFLSYGGSSLIINFILIGLVQSVVRSIRIGGVAIEEVAGV